jgi:hypothetical protein
MIFLPTCDEDSTLPTGWVLHRTAIFEYFPVSNHLSSVHGTIGKYRQHLQICAKRERDECQEAEYRYEVMAKLE